MFNREWYKIYIDGVHWSESDNKPLVDHIHKQLHKWEVAVNTSGTTGNPKPVVHTPTFIKNVSDWNRKFFQLDKQSKMFSVYSPKGIAFTTMSLYPCVIAQCELYIETDLTHYVDRFMQVQPTHTLVLPNVWKALHKNRRWVPMNFKSCEQVLVGSDYTPVGMLEDIRAKGAKSVLNVYGSTEVPPCILISEQPNVYRLDSNPLADVRVENDEIVCKWRWQKQYWHSGDLVKDLGDGYYELAGRRANMFKMGDCGTRVYPEQVEQFVVKAGAHLALCRKVDENCTIYYTGDQRVDEPHVIRHALGGLNPGKVKFVRVQNIRVDDNLRKVDRTQTFE